MCQLERLSKAFLDQALPLPDRLRDLVGYYCHNLRFGIIYRAGNGGFPLKLISHYALLYEGRDKVIVVHLRDKLSITAYQ